MKARKFINPYIGGIILGLVLLTTYMITGRGLGASNAPMRTIVVFLKMVSQEHVDLTPYLAKYGAGDKNPFDNWIVFEVIGLIIGAFASAIISGRFKGETNHGPQITDKQRWLFAVIGGILFGYGARLAGGCTSGQALSGGATMALGSWIIVLAIFGGAFFFAYFVRKLWI